MKLKDLFYDKRPEENARYYDDKLGELNWVSKDNEWVGKYDGINCRLYYETNKAVLVYIDKKIWIPKSQIYNVRLRKCIFEIYIKENIIQ